MDILRVSPVGRPFIAHFLLFAGAAILAFYGCAAARAALLVARQPGANAALYYYRALERMPQIPVRTVNGVVPSISDYPLDKTTLQEVRAAKWSLRLLRLGSTMPYCNWGDKPIYGQFNFVPPLWVLGDARTLGDIALLQARCDWGKNLILEKRANELVIRSHLDVSPLVGAKEARRIVSLRVPLAPSRR